MRKRFILVSHHPCAVLVLDDEDVLERHVAPHVGRLQRHELAPRRSALVRHPRLVLHLKKGRTTTLTEGNSGGQFNRHFEIQARNWA